MLVLVGTPKFLIILNAHSSAECIRLTQDYNIFLLVTCFVYARRGANDVRTCDFEFALQLGPTGVSSSETRL